MSVFKDAAYTDPRDRFQEELILQLQENEREYARARSRTRDARESFQKAVEREKELALRLHGLDAAVRAYDSTLYQLQNLPPKSTRTIEVRIEESPEQVREDVYLALSTTTPLGAGVKEITFAQPDENAGAI